MRRSWPVKTLSRRQTTRLPGRSDSAKMNACLLTGLVNHYSRGRFQDNGASVILYGGDEAAVLKAFETELLSPYAEGDPAPTKVERMVCTQVLDHFLTETGNIPIDFPKLAEEIVRVVESTSPDDEEQGYWVDCDQCVGPSNPGSDLESLRQELPEEIRSSPNWSKDKSYFFLISILSPLPTRAEMAAAEEARWYA